MRDGPRSSIVRSAVYDCADYLLDQPGFARKRGGTSYSGGAMSGATYASGPLWIDYSTGAKLIAVGDNGNLFEISATTSDRGNMGAVYIPIGRPAKVGDIAVIPANDGTSPPRKAYVSSGTLTHGLVAGSPPAGAFTANYYGRIVLAGSDANPRRVYFSPLPDPETSWDTTNSYIDAEHNVTGMCALTGALLVFSAGYMERLSGYTPPPNSDMQIVTIDGIGCVDDRSIARYQAGCVFANLYGIYLTNGVSFQLLTEDSDGSGIGTYWQNLVAGYDSDWIIAGGVFQDNYWVTVTNGAQNVVSFVCHIPTRRWTRVENVNATGFAAQYGATPELHYADRNSARVVAISGCYVPGAGNKNDANGSPVQPLVEYRMIGDGPSLKAYLDARLTYDLRDAGGDNPTLAVEVATGVEADSFSAVAESPLVETSTAARKRVTLAKDAQSLNVKITQTGASSKTELYGFEADVRSYYAGLDGVGS